MPKLRTITGRKEKALDDLWGKEASSIIKSAMARNNIKAPELAEMLTEHGRPIEAQALRNKLSRADYKAAWFLDVMLLLGQTQIYID